MAFSLILAETVSAIYLSRTPESFDHVTGSPTGCHFCLSHGVSRCQDLVAISMGGGSWEIEDMPKIAKELGPLDVKRLTRPG